LSRGRLARIDDLTAEVARLRTENQQLRTENARLRAELAGKKAGTEKETEKNGKGVRESAGIDR
jgi:regulator of replication initiation timing